MPEVTATEGIYVILVDDTVEALTADATKLFQKIRLYPAKAVATGVLTANGNDVYLGRSATYLPDKRQPADVDYPVEYELQLGQKMQLAQVHVRGKAGDGVFYSYI